MCVARPCRCSIAMMRVGSIDEVFAAPGNFYFGTVRDGDTSYRMLWVQLPCEGGELHGLPLMPAPAARAAWEWDGNEDRPTLKPSVLTWRRKDQNKPDTPDNRDEVWHGWITAGQLRSC